MAYIYFNCASCEGKLKTTDNSIFGKRIRCPRCGEPCPVPMSEKDETEPAPALEEVDLEAASGETADFIPQPETAPVEPDADNLLDEFLDEESPAKTDDDLLADVSGLEEPPADIDETDLLGEIGTPEIKDDEPELPDLESETKPKKKKKKKKKGGVTVSGLFAGLLSLSYLGALGAVASGVWNPLPDPKSLKKQLNDRLNLKLTVDNPTGPQKKKKFVAPKDKKEILPKEKDKKAEKKKNGTPENKENKAAPKTKNGKKVNDTKKSPDKKEKTDNSAEEKDGKKKGTKGAFRKHDSGRNGIGRMAYFRDVTQKSHEARAFHCKKSGGKAPHSKTSLALGVVVLCKPSAKLPISCVRLTI